MLRDTVNKIEGMIFATLVMYAFVATCAAVVMYEERTERANKEWRTKDYKNWSSEGASYE